MPTYSETTERLWSRLPLAVQEEDIKYNDVLKKYIASVTDQAAVVEGHLDSIAEGALLDPYGEPFDPAMGLRNWLKWIAMIRGVRINNSSPLDEQQDELDQATSYNTGTLADIIKTAGQGLTGTKGVAAYKRSSTLADRGTQSVWHILIVTRASETPVGYDPVSRVIAAGSKPAGVALHYQTFESTWDALEAAYGTWDAFDSAGSWTAIEEVGA